MSIYDYFVKEFGKYDSISDIEDERFGGDPVEWHLNSIVFNVKEVTGKDYNKYDVLNKLYSLFI